MLAQMCHSCGAGVEEDGWGAGIVNQAARGDAVACRVAAPPTTIRYAVRAPKHTVLLRAAVNWTRGSIEAIPRPQIAV